MDSRSLFLVLVVGACGGKGMPPAYPLEKFAARATSGDCSPGTLAPGLGPDAPDAIALACDRNLGAREARPDPDSLTFISYTDGNLCFRIVGADNTTSPDEAVYQRELENRRAWAYATDSLASLKGPVNIPPAGASTKWNVKVGADVHFDKEKDTVQIDSDTTVTIEKNKMTTSWELSLCAPDFVLPPNAKHLVVVVPQGLYGANWAPPEDNVMVPDNDFDSYREDFPWTAASVMIWNIQPTPSE